MRFEFSFSQGFHHFKPYQDKYWADPGIAMSMYHERKFIGAAGVTIMSEPKIMVIDPINIMSEYRGSFALFAMIRRLHSIAKDLGVKRYVMLCMHSKPEQLVMVKKLGCIPYDSDEQGTYCIGDVPEKLSSLGRGRRRHHEEKAKAKTA